MADIRNNADYKNSPVGKETERLYGDIIHLSRPASARPRMDLTQRAKIFAPYDALRGFDEAIDASIEQTEEVSRIELSDEQKEFLSQKLLQLRKGMEVRIQHFVPEQTEDKGKYVTLDCILTDIDPASRLLKVNMQDDNAASSFKKGSSKTAGSRIDKTLPTAISFENILDISESPL